MVITRAEENKNRLISGLITLGIFGALLLFLIFFNMITKDPPFANGGGSIEMGLGQYDVGTGEIDYGSMGSVSDVVAAKTEKEEVLKDDLGEEVPLENEEKPTVKNNQTVITPVKPKEPVKELTLAEKIALKAKNNKGQNGGGIGQSDKEGENGKPDGDPFKKGNGTGKGGTGTGTGSTNGPGSDDGPPGKGTGGTRSGISINLDGRAVVQPPKLPSDTQEEGKVVVDIVVNDKGEVIEASPNGRGTTTNSVLLKAKAKKAAMATRFNVDGKFEEQRGTITIIFSFD
ncbi:MAG: hypothetical protein IT236_10855 [Bacteroidia bacterium]|nr:hypothetical protein [Bacteroidia bacterium]